MFIVIVILILLILSFIALIACGAELVALDNAAKENEIKDLASMKITFDGPSKAEAKAVTNRLLKQDRKRRTTRKPIWTIR